MSTIASPRPSITLSSRRSSNSTITGGGRSTSATRPPPSTTRRNRAALREFYGLRDQQEAGAGNGSESSTSTSTPARGGSLEEHAPSSELDKQDFEAEVYVGGLLAQEGLEGLLRVSAGISNEIRGFDGERKGLVYDNYSKLIGACDVIRKMRTNMDPLTPTTTALTPAISHIAETASTLSESLKKLAPPEQSDAVLSERKKERQRETVRWVLDAPERLRKMREEGHIESSRKEWEQIKVLLTKWKSVQGVDEVRNKCEEVMGAEAGV